MNCGLVSESEEDIESSLKICFDRIMPQQVGDKLCRCNWIIPNKANGHIAVVAEELPDAVLKVGMVNDQHAMGMVWQRPANGASAILRRPHAFELYHRQAVVSGQIVTAVFFGR